MKLQKMLSVLFLAVLLASLTLGTAAMAAPAPEDGQQVQDGQQAPADGSVQPSPDLPADTAPAVVTSPPMPVYTPSGLPASLTGGNTSGSAPADAAPSASGAPAAPDQPTAPEQPTEQPAEESAAPAASEQPAASEEPTAPAAASVTLDAEPDDQAGIVRVKKDGDTWVVTSQTYWQGAPWMMIVLTVLLVLVFIGLFILAVILVDKMRR